jgi:hypothetical protein
MIVIFIVNDRPELTPQSWVVLEKPTVAQLLNNFPTFYKTRRYITVLPRAHPGPALSQINPLHTTPSYLSKIHFNIILSPTFRSS